MKIETGQVYAIKLSNGKYTLAQLFNTYRISKKTTVDTFAFFNILVNSVAEIDIKNFDFCDPFCIATINGTIRQYGWKYIDTMPIYYQKSFTCDLDSTGYYKASSTDPSIFLEPYFGLFPWDGYYKDDLVNKYLLPNAIVRSDIKFMKDFSTNELKEIMPPNSTKLLERIKSEGI